ncbi:hypothetical protein Tco_1304812 [Tanacetum coccineum]
MISFSMEIPFQILAFTGARASPKTLSRGTSHENQEFYFSFLVSSQQSEIKTKLEHYGVRRENTESIFALQSSSRKSSLRPYSTNEIVRKTWSNPYDRMILCLGSARELHHFRYAATVTRDQIINNVLPFSLQHEARFGTLLRERNASRVTGLLITRDEPSGRSQVQFSGHLTTPATDEKDLWYGSNSKRVRGHTPLLPIEGTRWYWRQTQQMRRHRDGFTHRGGVQRRHAQEHIH